MHVICSQNAGRFRLSARFAVRLRTVCSPFATRLQPIRLFRRFRLLNFVHQGSLNPLKAQPVRFGAVRALFPTLKSMLSGRTPYAPFGADK